MTLDSETAAERTIVEKEADLVGQQLFIVGFDDITVAFIFDEFQGTARIGGGQDRFLRKEGFEGDVAIVFVIGGEIDGEASGVQFKQALIVHIAEETRHGSATPHSRASSFSFDNSGPEPAIRQRIVCRTEPQGPDQPIDTFQFVQTAYRQDVIAITFMAITWMQFGRVVEGRRSDAVEFQQPLADIVRNREDAFVALNRLVGPPRMIMARSLLSDRDLGSKPEIGVSYRS